MTFASAAARQLLSVTETVILSCMETNSWQPTPADEWRTLDDALRASRRRLADGLRSPWWFHALYGLSVACIAYGVAGRPVGWGILFLVPGLGGEIAVSRWRANRLGLSRANPSRFMFLRIGAPWSAISFGAFVAALALGVFARTLSPIWIAAAAAAAGVVMAGFGPLADRSARRRLAHTGI